MALAVHIVKKMTRLLAEKRIHRKLLLKLEYYEKQTSTYSQQQLASFLIDYSGLNTNWILTKCLKVSTVLLEKAKQFDTFLIDSTLA